MTAPAPAPDDQPTALDAALAYAARGWHVLPIRPGGKAPPMQSWQHAATDDADTIRNWYRGLYGKHGVGIATGHCSGIFVLDVDVSDGKHGDDTLAELVQTYGKLPDTVRAITGSHGQHIYFNLPPGVDIRNNASTRLGPGLDIRGEGGQVVAAPTVHPNGRRYEWEDGHSPDDVPVADAPAWLLERLTIAPQPERKATTGQVPVTIAGRQMVELDDSIAARINSDHDWHDLLYTDGWHKHSDVSSGDTMWTRPGKNVRDGASAVLHEPDGPLVVFSTDASLSALHDPQASTTDGTGWSWSLFGYLAATRHGGDRSACAREYRQALNSTVTNAVQVLTSSTSNVAHQTLAGEVAEVQIITPLVDWSTFWDRDHNETDWLAEPLIANGRGHAIFAPGGTGKSLLSLWLAAGIATGRPLFTADKGEPRHTLYLDYEMTESDLFERLDAMGYAAADDLTHLHYALLPSLPPLDTEEGGKVLLALARQVHAEVVVIDTFTRAVAGDENEADTTRGFYRHTGMPLKSDGITWVRTDHSGKDAAKGQRGSSAKNDDVDIVWQMTVAEGGYALKALKRRVGWVPETVDVIKRDDPWLTFAMSIDRSVPAGTVAMIELLDTLGVDPQASRRAAASAVREAGHKARNAVVASAQNRRKNRLKVVPDRRGPLVGNEVGDRSPDHGDHLDKTPGQSMGTTSGTTGDHSICAVVPVGPSLERDQRDSTATPEQPSDTYIDDFDF